MSATFEKIAAGLQDAVAFAGGTADRTDYGAHVSSTVDVKAIIRKSRRLSQAAFAARYGFSVGRVRDWEQNRSSPDRPTRLLLEIIEKEPEAVERATTAASFRFARPSGSSFVGRAIGRLAIG